MFLNPLIPLINFYNKLLFDVKVSVDQLKKRAERFGMNVSSISQKVTFGPYLMNLSCLDLSPEAFSVVLLCY